MAQECSYFYFNYVPGHPVSKLISINGLLLSVDSLPDHALNCPPTHPLKSFAHSCPPFHKSLVLPANSPATSSPEHQPLSFLNSLEITGLRFKDGNLGKRKWFDINLMEKRRNAQDFFHTCFFSIVLQVCNSVPTL